MRDDTQNVLLVSGRALERTAIGEYLRGCGYHVIEAVDGDEALAALEHKAIDIVISDVQLRHHGSGHAVSAMIKSRYPGMKVILVSAVEQAVDTAVELCHEGPSEVLPYHPERLMREIQMLRGK